MTLSISLNNKIADTFHVFSISSIIDEIGEDRFNNLVSDFSCPYDGDIEFFLKKKSIIFEKQDISRTYLIGYPRDGTIIIVAYFAIALKPFIIHKECSKSFKKKLGGQHSNAEIIPGALIGQISKNYYCSLNDTISGKDIVAEAIEKIKLIYQYIGIRIIFLECQDKESLRKFYEGLGFMLYQDSSGNPIRNNNGLLCYLARTKDIIIQK